MKNILYLIINKMPFELGAKKAGLSLVRAFLHSIEGTRPYILNNSAHFQKWSKNATQSATSTRPTATERWSQCKVNFERSSCRITRRCFPLQRRQKMIITNNNQSHITTLLLATFKEVNNLGHSCNRLHQINHQLLKTLPK